MLLSGMSLLLSGLLPYLGMGAGPHMPPPLRCLAPGPAYSRCSVNVWWMDG